MQFKDKQIILDKEELKAPKKITGTRFGAILGYNHYSTPFEVWADMMHVYTKPFDDSIYTKAGKIIEPKQAEYIRESFDKNIIYPKEIFGDNYFNDRKGDFFEDEHFGGMWDYLSKIDDTVNCVFEMKTAGKSKKKDWSKNKIPESYALQASLYAYLLGIDNVNMVATFLNQKDGDYTNPECFIVSDENTIIKSFKISEKYPKFQIDYINKALDWWNEYIVTGISPKWDDKKDAEILDAIMNKKSSNIVFDDAELLIKKYSATLDNILNSIDTDINNNFIKVSAKNYYLKLPVEIYTVSTNMKKIDNDIVKTEINKKLDIASQKLILLENYMKEEN